MINRFVFLFIFVSVCLSGVEVCLENFKAQTGEFFVIPELTLGKIQNDFLEQQHIEIEVIQLEPEIGTLQLQLAGNLTHIHSIELVPFPRVTSHSHLEVNPLSEKMILTFTTNGDLGPDTYLKVNPYLNHKRGISFLPEFTLLMRGDSLTQTHSYQVNVLEARDDLGTNLQEFNPTVTIDFYPSIKGYRNSAEDERTIVFTIKEPPQNAKKIDYIKGEVILEKNRTKEFDFDLTLGKIQNSDLEKAGIELVVQKLEDNEVFIDYSNKQNRAMKIKVDFRNESYTKFSEQTKSIYGQSTFIAKTDGAMKKMGLHIVLLEPDEQLIVPFELKNLLLRTRAKPFFWPL